MSRVLKNKEEVITQKYQKINHQAVDLIADEKKEDFIIAHSDGTIVFSQRNISNKKGSTGNISYGNCLKIKHKNNYYTLYAHMKKGTVKLKVGDSVKKGQVLGYMGDSGNSYGTHLHFEVWKNSTRINPTSYLKKDLPGNSTKTKVYYYKRYKGKSLSLVDALKNLGITSSFTNRRIIANKNGIKSYFGTKSQNEKLLGLLKNGKLVK